MSSSSAVTIVAVGDFMIDHRPPAGTIKQIASLLEGADVTIGNLDTVLSDLGQPMPKWSNLRGPRQAAADLRAMGFDVATLANNHAMDFRAEGMLDMRQALIDAGVRPVGAGADLAAATAPIFMTAGERTVAILSMSCTLPPDAAAGAAWPGIAPVRVHQAYATDLSLAAEQPGSAPTVIGWLDEADLDRARGDVARARQQADIVIAAVHWGVPAPWRAPVYPVVQEHQRLLGHALIDAGADAILGNHAHELHEVELYNGKSIAYCLGNFLIDTISIRPWMGRETVALRLSFPPTGAPSVHVQPLLLDEDGYPGLDLSHTAIEMLRASSANSIANIDVEPDGIWFRLH